MSWLVVDCDLFSLHAWMMVDNMVSERQFLRKFQLPILKRRIVMEKA